MWSVPDFGQVLVGNSRQLVVSATDVHVTLRATHLVTGGDRKESLGRQDAVESSGEVLAGRGPQPTIVRPLHTAVPEHGGPLLRGPVVQVG